MKTSPCLWIVLRDTDRGLRCGAGAFFSPAQSPAIERARREARLLDDIYKTAIVLITKHYVEDDSALAAGEAFKSCSTA